MLVLVISLIVAFGEARVYSVKAGDNLTIGCGGEDCLWEKLNTDVLEKTSRVGLKRGTLEIRPILAEDYGKYQCSSDGERKCAAEIEVEIEPTLPHISEAVYGDWLESSPGNEVILSCFARSLCRPYDMFW